MNKDVIIRQPIFEDMRELHQLFEIVIKDTFIQNGIDHLTDLIDEEICDKKNFLNECIDSHGTRRFFLLAELEGKIVGTIEYGPSNELIHKCTNGELSHLYEIGTVYVLPKYQNQGIGKRLFDEIMLALKKLGIKECCIDSGYPKAQQMWSRKLGSPTYHLKDYWSEGSDHMVWRLKVK